MSEVYSVGDFVRLTDKLDRNIAVEGLEAGDVIQVIADPMDGAVWHFSQCGVEVDYANFYPHEFAAAEAPPTQPEDLGVYRPELGTRKVGKTPLHMVFDGFPHALQHVAEIMGWAEEKKGYKLHDWKNLPGAALEFPAANYRHANDNSKQKSLGVTVQGRVDHESAKLHIGHQVFNLLAELELVLTGKVE